MRSVSVFANLETTIKWQIAPLTRHEFVMSAGLSIEWGGTGSRLVGAESISTYTPTVWLGKGFGDLPESMKWLRPLAITGQFGYAIPASAAISTIDPDTGDTDMDFHPQVLQW